MSIRNLDSLFDPASVAVLGASDRPASVGATVWRNLVKDFKGRLWPVNPRLAELDGVPVCPDVAALPQAPELAVICTPPATVPGLVAQLAERGTRAAIVLTAGLTPAQKQAMLDAARPHVMRLLGPNCIGALVPRIGLNASFSHIGATPGALAFVSQSGALVTAMLDWAAARGIGFSHFVSLGEHADVDFGDMLDFLASDPHTRAILLYVESVSEARKFMSAARAAARNKPVIVVKSGRSAQGQRAAASHTGALAGSDAVFDAAIRRAGMLRVDSLNELFLAAETLTRFRGNTAPALTILTNGGGAGVMAADAAATAGVELAELASATFAALDAVLPPNWSHANPLDIIGDAPAERYVQTLQALQADPAAGAVLFIHAPTAIVPSLTVAQALLPLATAQPPRLLGCWLGGDAVQAARQAFRNAGVADFDTPEDAVRGFALQQTYRANQAQLIETPAVHAAGPAPDASAARQVIAAVLAQGRDLLTEPEAKAVLAAYGIPVVATRAVGPSADEVVAAAQAIGFPVALKILSPDISHKSDVGGVRLGLDDADELRRSAQAMLAQVARARPEARITGFTVQAMAQRANAQELIVGASMDPTFGPVILFGQGGTAVEVLADRALALPPLNGPLARALIARTRVARLLKGWRDVPPVDLDAVDDVLMSVSQLLADLPEVAELDINPLLASAQGVVALDARIRVDAARPGGAARFAIRPYPAHLSETLDWAGRRLTLRPIRPEDEAQHLAFLGHLAPEDVRMRVFYSRRSIEHSELARLTQIDYAREMAFIATETDAQGQQSTLGVVRAVADPDNQDAEFAIVVRSDLKGGGLGDLLMNKIIGYQRSQGTQRLTAVVLRENARMLELAADLGFVRTPTPQDTDTVTLALPLQAP
ncbi:acyl-CoA synthetase (NDP forming) [Burkholderiales bacterium JOSHI_001]|nr:acyl-CoA synthetase (NDP forming) [Burkholderiales bacterium JOSHI_001]